MIWLTLKCQEVCGVTVAVRAGTTQITVLTATPTPHLPAWSAGAAAAVVTAFVHSETAISCADLRETHSPIGKAWHFRVAGLV